MTQPSPDDGSAPIVVGYSSKPEGRAALKRAIAEADLRAAELIVVRTEPGSEPAELLAELAAADVRYDVRGSEGDTDPAENLLSAADSSGAEFIVIGLRRRSAVGKLLLGSSAQRVLLDATCPVLAVKAESS